MTILDVGLVTTDRTAESIIERCRVLDVKLVTLKVATMPGFKENHSPDLDAMRTLQGRLADAGISIAAMNQWVGPDQRGGPEAAMIENPSAHRREIDGHLRTLEVQGELGINQQLHYIDTPLPADPAKDELYWTNLIDIVGEISSQAEASKVRIGHHGIWRCLTDELRDQAISDGVTEAEYRQYLRHDQHGHPGWRGPYLVRKADDVGRLADSNPNPYHGITMCTGMYITGAEPVIEIPKFAGRINFVQIRDLDARWPAAREVFPGTGNLDFKEILRQLLRAGYSGFLHPEHLGHPRWPGEDQVLEATKVLKTWVDEVEAEAEFQ